MVWFEPVKTGLSRLGPDWGQFEPVKSGLSQSGSVLSGLSGSGPV